MSAPATQGLVEVRLLSLSIQDYRDASEHHDELFREFALIVGSEPSPGTEVPARLLTLIDELNERYGSFGASNLAAIEAAHERGDEVVDLVYVVPPEMRDVCRHFGALLADADDYCRSGDLLTLAPPPEAVTFRNWFLGEFVAQIDGSDPTPWPEYRARATGA